METVQTAGVLDQRELPRHRERKEQRIEPRIVESFADVSTGGENDPQIIA
jgi:hypothetical protein